MHCTQILEYVAQRVLPNFDKIRQTNAGEQGAIEEQTSAMKLELLRLFAELAINGGKPDALEAILLHVLNLLNV